MAAETAEIDRLIAKHRETINELEPSLQMTRDAAISLEEQNLTPEVKQLEDTFKSYLLLEYRLTKVIEALQDIKKLSPKFLDEKLDVAKQFEKILQQTETDLQATAQDQLKKDKRLKDFKMKIHAINHRDEALPDDLGDGELFIMGSQEEVLNCPITKIDYDLEENIPMTNPPCGHTYSRKGIMDYISRKVAAARGRNRAQVAPCPVAGCSQQVDASKLEVNVEMQRKLTKASRKKPSATKKRKPTDAEDEEVLQL